MYTLKHKLILIILTLLTLSVGFASTPVFAQPAPCGDSCSINGGPSGTSSATGSNALVASDPDCNDSSPSGLQNCLNHNKIIGRLNGIVDFLSAGVGIVVIGSIIVGAIQYIVAGDSPDAVGKAKQRITNALLALVAFIFIFAFLQWIIPGGL